jgi:hypothetical protein
MLMIGGTTKPTNGPLLYANITSNTETYTFNPAKVSGYIAGNTTATLTITDNVYLYSNDVSIPALTVDGWNPNDTVYIINRGYILGRGGDGGTYVSPEIVQATGGGTAIKVTANTTIFNYNSIAGGGGGGGSGNRNTMGGGGGGAGGGYGGDTFSGSTAGGTETPATLSNIISFAGIFNPLSPPSFLNPSASIVVSSVGALATTYGVESGGTSPLANNAYIKINGTKITCPDRTGRKLFSPPKVGNIGDIPLSSRGINMVVLNPQNLAVESAICYDTWADSTTGDINALLLALQGIPTGRIIVMASLDAFQMTTAIANELINNYGGVTTNPKTWAQPNSQSRRAFVFIGLKGAQPLSSLHQITAVDTNAMIFASAAFTAGSSGGGVAIGGAGGAIGQVGANGSITISSTTSRYGSGGGGGRIINGVGGRGGIPSANVTGFGGGAGGGGGGADGLPSQATGGAGGSANEVGYNAVNNNTTEGGGGGGGWGASGGFGTLGAAGSINNVATPGSGGKSIERNGKQVILAMPGTLYGPIV